MKGSENVFRTENLKKNPSVLVTSYLQLAQSSRLGIGIKLYST